MRVPAYYVAFREAYKFGIPFDLADVRRVGDSVYLGTTFTGTDASDSPKLPDTTVCPGARPTAHTVAMACDSLVVLSAAEESLTIDSSRECHLVPEVPNTMRRPGS